MLHYCLLLRIFLNNLFLILLRLYYKKLTKHH
nr:MAG TPA: hypothetical protein [Caudoviricetes sp.]